MSIEKIADTYSTAIFQLGQEAGLLEKFDLDLTYVQDVFSTHDELRQVLVNPTLEGEGKKKILSQIFSAEVHSLVMNFLCVMVDRGRSRYILDTARAYLRHSRASRGIMEAIVTVTEPLSDTSRHLLKEKLLTLTGKECIIEERINKSILGGMIIQLGDTRIDGSLTRRLEELKKSLLTSKIQ